MTNDEWSFERRIPFYTNRVWFVIYRHDIVKLDKLLNEYKSIDQNILDKTKKEKYTLLYLTINKKVVSFVEKTECHSFTNQLKSKRLTHSP